MITTKDINVILEKGQGKLKQMTTKDVDASIKVVQPKEPVKPKIISTHSMADVADIMDKKKRDDIMAQRKANRAIKADEEKIVMVEINKKREEKKESSVYYEEGAPVHLDENGNPVIEVKSTKTLIEQMKENNIKVVIDEEGKEKKPWKEMTDAEKSEEMKRRAVKAKATRARKKKE